MRNILVAFLVFAASCTHRGDEWNPRPAPIVCSAKRCMTSAAGYDGSVAIDLSSQGLRISLPLRYGCGPTTCSLQARNPIWCTIEGTVLVCEITVAALTDDDTAPGQSAVPCAMSGGCPSGCDSVDMASSCMVEITIPSS
ncbi:MAG TPA: hypothetical protein DCS05_09640 [Nitrospiraceae bacterium]|nr:hypothetical protein [Nitrospiraceae bacterium]